MTLATVRRPEIGNYLDSIAGFSSQGARLIEVDPVPTQQYAFSGEHVIKLDPRGKVVRVNIAKSSPAVAHLRKLTNTLSEFVNLPLGWDGYDGVPTSEAAALKALHILLSIMSDESIPPALVPTSQGGIQLEWHSSGYDVEIEVRRDGRIECYVERDAKGESWVDHQVPNDRSFQEALTTVLDPK